MHYCKLFICQKIFSYWLVGIVKLHCSVMGKIILFLLLGRNKSNRMVSYFGIRFTTEARISGSCSYACVK